jgi:hypothetical protein
MGYLEGFARVALVSTLWLGLAAPAAAQSAPFLFLTTTSEPTQLPVRFDYDIGIGERAFQSDIAHQPEERVGVKVSRGRLTLVARFGMTDVGSAYQSSQAAEALFTLLNGRRRVDVAAGGGVLHEADGVDVLLARVVAGRNTDASRLYGNLLFQKPLAGLRDEADLITSVGWARVLTHGVSLGVEAVGEDLEGFWDPHEAEGGAHLLVGPSLHFSPAGGRWHLTATGGPVFHSSASGRTSGALRDLPSDARRANYAVRLALSMSLVSRQ